MMAISFRLLRDTDIDIGSAYRAAAVAAGRTTEASLIHSTYYSEVELTVC